MTETRDAPPPETTGDGWLDPRRFARVAKECDWTLGELSEFYLQGTSEQLQDIRQALTAGDAKEVRRLAHGSAGSSGTCGVEGMARLFRQLEHAALDGRLDAAAELVGRVEDGLAEVTAELERLSAG